MQSFSQRDCLIIAGIKIDNVDKKDVDNIINFMVNVIELYPNDIDSDGGSVINTPRYKHSSKDIYLTPHMIEIGDDMYHAESFLFPSVRKSAEVRKLAQQYHVEKYLIIVVASVGDVVFGDPHAPDINPCMFFYKQDLHTSHNVIFTVTD